MKHLPLFLAMEQRTCLVVGGGDDAERKLGILLKAGTTVKLIAQTPNHGIREWLRTDSADNANYNIVHENRNFLPIDLDGVALVLAATNCRETNLDIARQATARDIPVNVANQSKHSTFLLPSIVDRDPILIAVGSGGQSPILARIITARIDAFIPQSYQTLARLAADYKEKICTSMPTLKTRKRFWETVFNGHVGELVLGGKESEARELIENSIKNSTENFNDHTTRNGEVYLVGAGPGDPDLLTFRALRLINSADVVLYDRLVSEPILRLCRKDAEKIYVGKQRSDHAMPQESINDTLVNLARSGKRVLRLKGGDPFIFGRGGEEIETLAEHHIPFQVVPGITAATGCSAYAGIPLTHRDHAQSCVFVTGHLKNGTLDLAWQTLVQPGQTLVCYMGLTGLPVICQKLIEHGMDEKMPAALIERGTTSSQRVHVGTVTTLPSVVKAASVRAPTLIIVGTVVNLHNKLAWF